MAAGRRPLTKAQTNRLTKAAERRASASEQFDATIRNVYGTGNGPTLAAIAEVVGLTKGRVHQIVTA